MYRAMYGMQPKFLVLIRYQNKEVNYHEFFRKVINTAKGKRIDTGAAGYTHPGAQVASDS